jgi:hypothetical protein
MSWLSPWGVGRRCQVRPASDDTKKPVEFTNSRSASVGSASMLL